MADRTVEIQKAFVAILKADAGVAALVGARVYDKVPEATAFPYLSLGVVSGVPFDAEGLRGMQHIFDVHVWSRTVGAVECRRICAAVNEALHWAALTLDGGASVFCRATSRRDMDDPDGVTTHGVVTFEILTDG